MENKLGKNVELGDRASDTITGYEGIVMSRINYLTGCDHVGLLDPQKRDDDGKPAKWIWFDVTRVTVQEKGAVNLKAPMFMVGGPRPGDKVRDVITGHMGIAMSRQQILTGREEIGIQSKDLKDKKTGEPIDWIWFDIERIETLEVNAVSLGADKEAQAADNPGGPAPHGTST